MEEQRYNYCNSLRTRRVRTNQRLISIGTVCLVVTAVILGFITFEQEVVSAPGIMIYVDDNYTFEDPTHKKTIQAGVNAAWPGDTVYVYSGKYNEKVLVNKAVNLFGENKDTTIIEGDGNDDVVLITADSVNIKDFTITGGGSVPYAAIKLDCTQNCRISYNNLSSNGWYGIRLVSSSRNNITDNNAMDNAIGIYLREGSSENTIAGNIVTLNGWSGIYLDSSPNNLITGNSVSNTNHGIHLSSSNNMVVGNNISNQEIGIEVEASYNDVIGNNVTNNRRGIYIFPSTFYNNIKYNIITYNEYGIFSDHSFYNNITSNKVLSNSNYGIYLSNSSNNRIFHNSIINNANQAFDDRMDNFWNNTYPSGGNYWSDYLGIDDFKGPNQNIPGSDGIGDMPYLGIDGQGGGRDRYPLIVTSLLTPTLYINISPDGKDVILSWDPPPAQAFDPYLIYRSTDPTNFNFSNPWLNTSKDKEPGELFPIPDRTMWNDTNAALPGHKNFKEEYYYTIRAYNDRGQFSKTSRTVGKLTKIFPKGVSSFSVPLEPIGNFDVEWLTSDMNADYIKYMNTTTHTWMQHNFGDGNLNNTQMKLGEGYEVKFNDQTTYTFTGLPGAMVSFYDKNKFLGFNFTTDAKSLVISVEPNGDVNLTWQEPTSMGPGDMYWVFYSNKRDGFFGDFGFDYELACAPLSYGTNTTTHVNAQANNPGTRLYNMVVPFNAIGIRGSSTYSIGIWTEEFLPQYDTIGIPLRLSGNQTVDWYCDNIPDAVGINYFIHSEQRWSWHSTRMPGGAYDPILKMAEGYQISTSNATKFTFIGV